MNVVKKLPITTTTGGQYGQAKTQADAQRAVPMAPQSLGASAPRVLPGASPFDRPTERPDEPVTHGAPSGPGAGSDILGPMPLDETSIASSIAFLAQQTGSPDLADLAQRAAQT